MNEFNKIVEVGASDHSNCYSKRFFNYAEEIHLFEPNKVLFKPLEKEVFYRLNVELHAQAVGDSEKKVKFFNWGLASWIQGSPSFTANQTDLDDNKLDIEQYYQMLVTEVDMVPITVVDDGNIDYLSINCSGSELLVLSQLVSRPKIIRACFYTHNRFMWDHTNSVIETVSKMGYNLVVRDKSQYDTYFEVEFIKK